MFSNNSMKSKARMRWNILSNALHNSSSIAVKSEPQLASKRLFTSFGLIDLKYKQINNNSNEFEEKWFEVMFSNQINDKPFIEIRFLTQKLPIRELFDTFDNTGNVCLWPSEEVLSYYCYKKRDLCTDKVVLELGGGMTCLCGLVSAVFTDAKQVILTDGNHKCINNIKAIVERNSNRFNKTIVKYKKLKWGEDCDINEFLNKIDVIFCSDCLYFEESHHSLVETIFKLLNSCGIAIILAPTRGSTLNDFVNIAKEKFEIKRMNRYDDKVWEMHNHFLNTLKPPHYETDSHFPVMITLRKL